MDNENISKELLSQIHKITDEMNTWHRIINKTGLRYEIITINEFKEKFEKITKTECEMFLPGLPVPRLNINIDSDINIYYYSELVDLIMLEIIANLKAHSEKYREEFQLFEKNNELILSIISSPQVNKRYQFFKKEKLLLFQSNRGEERFHGLRHIEMIQELLKCNYWTCKPLEKSKEVEFLYPIAKIKKRSKSENENIGMG
jgi:hypothetical protein